MQLLMLGLFFGASGSAAMLVLCQANASSHDA